MQKHIYKKIIELIEKYKSSGFTIRIENNKIYPFMMRSGYLISYKTLMTIDFNKHNIDKKENIFINKPIFVKDFRFKKHTVYILGGWFNKNNNQYSIELNYIMLNKQSAFNLAKKHDQKFIWDIENKKCIQVEKKYIYYLTMIPYI
jgi:hypothetical protein